MEFTTSRGDCITIDMFQIASVENLGPQRVRVFLRCNSSGFELAAEYSRFRDLWCHGPKPKLQE